MVGPQTWAESQSDIRRREYESYKNSQIKDWQQSDFANAAALLELYTKTQATGAFGWVNEYKPLAQKYLADYRLFAEWKARPKNATGPERLAAELSILHATQNKIQTRGRIAEAFKDDENSLDRQLAESKKASLPPAR